MWSSGLTEAPSRKITKQGPAELRLALYQAANVARRRDPQLAEHYRRLMFERGHNHISANTAVARKLACRAWAIATTGRPYEPRDLDGNPISLDEAAASPSSSQCPTTSGPADADTPAEDDSTPPDQPPQPALDHPSRPPAHPDAPTHREPPPS